MAVNLDQLAIWRPLQEGAEVRNVLGRDAAAAGGGELEWQGDQERPDGGEGQGEDAGRSRRNNDRGGRRGYRRHRASRPRRSAAVATCTPRTISR
ncbi:hypothetical protein ACP4OV_012042 [Aristida adscensionis]